MNVLESKASLSIFEGLRSYSRAEADLLNGFGDLFHAASDWRAWLQDGLGQLLEVAGERVVHLKQTSQVEPSESRALNFQKDEIGIGRDPNKDVVIALPGIGRNHARITRSGGEYFLEDLGSANGTYLNDVRLNPLAPVPLEEGAQFLIFPYQFVFSSEQTWIEHEPIQAASGPARVVAWKHRRASKSGGNHFFSIKVSPGVGSAVLGASRDFLKILAERAGGGEINKLAPSDDGLFEFLMISVLERANRDLKFPFRFAITPFDAPADGELGVAIECVIGLTGAVGTVELFLPAQVLQEARRVRGEAEPVNLATSWPVMESSGHADLSVEEMLDLEIGDVLLVTSKHALLLPGTNHGWDAVLVDSEKEQLQILEYFERNDLIMESPDESEERSGSGSAKPNLGALPVRIHVVLSQMEMTLADLNKLTAGSIVELDRKKSEKVQLAVNGKIAGAGELVEIEGRLGVRILNWAAQ